MKRHRDRYGCSMCITLHDAMAAALAHYQESVLLEHFADVAYRETRSLPNLHLDLRNEHFVVEAPFDFRSGCGLEKQFERLDKI